MNGLPHRAPDRLLVFPFCLKPTRFHSIAAQAHVAPPPSLILACVQKQPLAFGFVAGSHLDEAGRGGQFGGLQRKNPNRRDAHKWLNVPHDCGIAIVRDADALRHAMSITAAYYGPLTKREPMQWCPESSRRARGVEMWAALRSLGKRGVAELIENCCAHALAFARGLSDAGYEVLNEVVLNQVLVSIGDDQTTKRVIKGIQADGSCWCGGTVWKGRKAMRISVSSWATTAADVSKSLEAMLAVAARVRNPSGPARSSIRLEKGV